MGDYEFIVRGLRVRFHLSSEHLVADGRVSFATVEEARSTARTLLARTFEREPMIVEQCRSWSCVIEDEQCNFIERIVLAALVDGIGGNGTGVKSFYPQ